jgi:rhodanese-related sulfurtransferase
MKTITLAVLALSLSLPAFAAKDPFKLIKADELSTEMHSSQPPAVFDANNKDTRAKYGVIPGAVLLPSYNKYDLSLLPKDKSKGVVFYCANTQCMASHDAAKKAAAAGYKDVAVMSDGIMGWAKAGKPVAKTPAKGKS